MFDSGSLNGPLITNNKNHPQLVLVQGKDLVMNEVNLNLLKCSCAKFINLGHCDHLDLATDIYHFKGRKYRFLIYSSLHKEIRRGNLELGTKWAEIVQIISGEMGLIKYCLKIVFEESRNIKLYYDLVSKSKSGLQMAQDLIRSIKKWELRCLPNHLENWMQGYEDYKNRPELTKKDFINLSKPSEAYRVWFYFKEHKEIRHELKEILLKKSTGNEILSKFLEQSGKSGYEFMIALEFLIGLLDPSEISLLKENSKLSGNKFIPRFEGFVEDAHTCTGKRLIKKNIDKFVNDEDLKETGLDLRYSGLICSSYKRELAYKKGLEDWEWDGIKIEKDQIKRVMELERFFYPSLFCSHFKKHL